MYCERSSSSMRFVTSPIFAALPIEKTSPPDSAAISFVIRPRLEVGERDVDRDEVDRRAGGPRVAQERVVLDVRAVVVAVGDHDERLPPLERPELVEAEDHGVVERRRALRLARRGPRAGARASRT